MTNHVFKGKPAPGRRLCFCLVGIPVWIFAAAVQAAAGTVGIQAPADSGPIQFGVGELRAALAAAGYEVGRAAEGKEAWHIVAGVLGTIPLPPGVRLPEKPESFALVPRPGLSRKLLIIGRDEVGTLYGLLELAERVRWGTPLEAIPPVVQSPFLEFRAVNPFLSLPDPDLDRWEDWWFLSEDFWRKYLGLLARARFNWVDLHGMLHIRGQWSFPCIFPYFVDSPTFPEVGIADGQKAKNLAMLQRVIALARQHGLRIALMSYHTSWNVPGAPPPPYPETEENLALYTRECVAELLRRCPGLGMIGFRIGESGKSEDFLRRSYLSGIADAGRPIPLYTRTWLSSKPKILELATAYPGRLTIEIKYNGEHFGLPYHVAGGRMAAWHSYSYQDYCVPPQPYRIVWQNRASGTHRLFRWGHPGWVARCVRSYPLGGARGFSLEPPNAYRPQYDYYHRTADLQWFRWVVERDWFWYLLWGRLSYHPDLDRRPWLLAFRERFGPEAAPPLLRTSERMSLIVPLIYAYHCQGPDHLNMAPEFETGGPLAEFASVQPLDVRAMQSIPEYVQRLVSGRLSARTSPLEIAAMMERAAREAVASIRQARLAAARGQAELADWEADIACLEALGGYYAHKIRAATFLELYRTTRDPDHWLQARTHTEQEVEKWRRLVERTEAYYRPFVESMRPRTDQFHWRDLLAAVEADLPYLDQVRSEVEAQGGSLLKGVQPKILTPLPLSVACQRLTATPQRQTFRVRVTLPAGRPAEPEARAFLYWKPLPSEFPWRRRRLAPRAGGFEATLEVRPVGAQWAVEVVTPEAGACWPDWRRETPYRTIAAWEGPTGDLRLASPLPDLKGFDLSRRRFSAVLCGRVAAALNGASWEQKAALLEQVAAGQTLVLFDQDYPGGFDPSWLPGGVRGTDDDFDQFQVLRPHPLVEGLPSVVRYRKIVNDALAGGDEQWLRLTEPWGLGVRTHGRGEIILLQIRVEETFEHPFSARLARNVLAYARRGSHRPLLILDEGNGALNLLLDCLGVDDYEMVEAEPRP